jgi:hypothetical protein
MKKMTKAQQLGKRLAQRMATRKPMTKRAMLKKWPAFGSIANIEIAIDWIEQNTVLSENPLLFVWENGEAVWGFRQSFGEVAINLKWNVRYLKTRTETFQKVLDHAINSPVVTMTIGEQRLAKSMAAQMGGVVAYLNAVEHALP